MIIGEQGIRSSFLIPEIKQGIEILVHSNIFISISATSVAITTSVLNGYSFDLLPFIIVFSATLFVYSLNRLTDFAEDQENLPGRAEFIERYGTRLMVMGSSLYLLAVLVSLYLGVEGVHYLVLPLFFIVIYSIAGFKKLLLVKNIVVGAAWTLIPTGIGYYNGGFLDPGIVFISGFVFVSITAAAMLFDIKDIEGDLKEGIRTVPNQYSPDYTRRICAFITLTLIPLSLGAAFLISSKYAVLLIYPIYMLSYIPYATQERGALFYGFVIDGEHVVAALIAVLIHIAI